MAEDASGRPLSQRVPGGTNRPAPQLRITPPVLPEALIERLRADFASARMPAPRGDGRSATEQAATPDAPAELRTLPRRKARGGRSARVTEARQRRPDEPPDSAGGAQAGIPVLGVADQEASGPTPSAGTGAGFGDGALRRASVAAHALARRPPLPSVPAVALSPTGQIPPPVVDLPRALLPQKADRPAVTPEPEPEPAGESVPVDNDQGPITEPLPVLSDPGASAIAGASALTSAAVPEAAAVVAVAAVAVVHSDAPGVPGTAAPPTPGVVGPSSHAGRPAAVAGAARGRPRRRATTLRPLAPASAESVPTMLRPLFADSDRGPIGEVVASVRTEVADGRRVRESRRFWSAGFLAAVGLAVLIVLVLVFAG